MTETHHAAGSNITRRTLLGRAAGLSAAAMVPEIIPSSAQGANLVSPPSERITVGLIGHGLMGRGHLRRLAGDRDIQVLAVCDVDRSRREQAKAHVEQAYSGKRRASYTGCAAYNDYRDLLARDDVDAVVIVTPDHWHTPLTMEAVKAGKDVYCEKPISLNVREGRQLAEAVHRYNRIFQTGTQYRSISTIRQVVHFVRNGGLGKVKSVFALWSSLAGCLGNPRFRPYAKALDIEGIRGSYVPVDVALPGEPVPDGLDWDLWLGPAPKQPYNPVFHTNPSPGVVPWCFCEDFGTASVTWHHSHSADVIQYALGVENGGPVELIHPRSGAYPTLTYRYATGTLLHLVDHWGMVKDLYQAVPKTARLAGNFGGLFVGERGWVTSMTTGGPIEAGPEGLFDEMKLRTRQVNPGDNNHHANWFECIRTRRQPSCGPEIGHRSASLGHLTIIAYKLGRSLKWDPENETFIDDDEATRLLTRSKRSPWSL